VRTVISSARSIASVTNSRGTSASFTDRVTSAIRADSFVAEAPRDQDALVVADLDLDMIREVRNTWQFFRDRRPDTYGALVAD
jgi:predicted amidohydrolase